VVLEPSTLPLSDLPDGWVVGSITCRYWIATAAPESIWKATIMPKGKAEQTVGGPGANPRDALLAAIALIPGGLT
jgi:hypothetical protein